MFAYHTEQTTKALVVGHIRTENVRMRVLTAIKRNFTGSFAGGSIVIAREASPGFPGPQRNLHCRNESLINDLIRKTGDIKDSTF